MDDSDIIIHTICPSFCLTKWKHAHPETKIWRGKIRLEMLCSWVDSPFAPAIISWAICIFQRPQCFLSRHAGYLTRHYYCQALPSLAQPGQLPNLAALFLYKHWSWVDPSPGLSGRRRYAGLTTESRNAITKAQRRPLGNDKGSPEERARSIRIPHLFFFRFIFKYCISCIDWLGRFDNRSGFVSVNCYGPVSALGGPA